MFKAKTLGVPLFQKPGLIWWNFLSSKFGTKRLNRLQKTKTMVSVLDFYLQRPIINPKLVDIIKAPLLMLLIKMK